LTSAYYPHRALRSDFAWVFYGSLIVVGYVPRSRRLAVVVNETANFIRHYSEPLGADMDLPLIHPLRGRVL
jgi:hypothetical protein